MGRNNVEEEHIGDAGTNSGGYSFGTLGGTEEERRRGVSGCSINVARASSTNHSPSDLQTLSSRGTKHPLFVQSFVRSRDETNALASKLVPRDHRVVPFESIFTEDLPIVENHR